MENIRLKTTHPQKFVVVEVATFPQFSPEPYYCAGIAYNDETRPILSIGQWKTLRGIKQGLNKKLEQKYDIELADDIEKLNAL